MIYRLQVYGGGEYLHRDEHFPVRDTTELVDVIEEELGNMREAFGLISKEAAFTEDVDEELASLAFVLIDVEGEESMVTVGKGVALCPEGYPNTSSIVASYLLEKFDYNA